MILCPGRKAEADCVVGLAAARRAAPDLAKYMYVYVNIYIYIYTHTWRIYNTNVLIAVII